MQKYVELNRNENESPLTASTLEWSYDSKLYFLQLFYLNLIILN